MRIFPKLEKMKIIAYSDEARTQEVDGGLFEVMFNPESYSLKYESVYQKLQGINTSGRKANYIQSKPRSLSVKLIIDGTGVAESSLALNPYEHTTDVYKKVQKFLSYNFDINGDIHEPNYLKIEWGDLIFNCKLKSANVTYTLFSRSGKPLRAELDTTFMGDIEDSERLKKDDFQSPDITHKRVVAKGETILSLTSEIYRSPSYYIRVAQANKLKSFRRLKPGQEIIFPPIEK